MGNPVLRIVLQRAWLNLQYPSVAQPILPLVQQIHHAQETDTRHDEHTGKLFHFTVAAGGCERIEPGVRQRARVRVGRGE